MKGRNLFCCRRTFMSSWKRHESQLFSSFDGFIDLLNFPDDKFLPFTMQFPVCSSLLPKKKNPLLGVLSDMIKNMKSKYFHHFMLDTMPSRHIWHLIKFSQTNVSADLCSLNPPTEISMNFSTKDARKVFRDLLANRLPAPSGTCCLTINNSEHYSQCAHDLRASWSPWKIIKSNAEFGAERASWTTLHSSSFTIKLIKQISGLNQKHLFLYVLYPFCQFKLEE